MTHVSAHDRSLRNTHDASNVVHREIRPDPNRNENTQTLLATQKYTHRSTHSYTNSKAWVYSCRLA